MAGKPKITVKKENQTEPLLKKAKAENSLEGLLLGQDKLTDLDIWALTAYAITPNEVLLWKATHPHDGMLESTMKARATAWLKTQHVKKVLDGIIANFNSGKKYVPVDVVLKMKKSKEEEEDDDINSMANREEIMKILSRRIKKSDGTDTEAIKLLANMEQWNKQKEEDNEDVQFNERIHLYIPITCNNCNRMGTVACGGCSFQKEASDNLTDEEREWINENDSIG